MRKFRGPDEMLVQVLAVWIWLVGIESCAVGKKWLGDTTDVDEKVILVVISLRTVLAFVDICPMAI
jgi:hypothetical protein